MVPASDKSREMEIFTELMKKIIEQSVTDRSQIKCKLTILESESKVMIRVMSEVDVKLGLRTVLAKIEEACKKRKPELQGVQPRLVAVTKTKPPELVIQAYEEGQRHFGENYVKELVEKANDPNILERCKEIKWHFIGNLQANKINKVLTVPNIHMIETVDDDKLATKLNSNWPKLGQPNTKLNVMIQVNTSAEDEKNGIEPDQVVGLAKFIIDNCDNLRLDGLMTIGKFGYNLENGPNPDFLCLRKCREDVCSSLGIDWKTLNLSMGMSDDFEHAIEMGSSNVRVGSLIFGSRPQKPT